MLVLCCHVVIRIIMLLKYHLCCVV